MTGIRERRFWPTAVRPSEVAAKAAEKVLAKSTVKRDDIDLLIYAGVCRDRIEPSTAAYVHRLLGLSSSVQIFDVSNACLGFLNAVVIASSMIESGQANSALIVSGEDGRPLLENTIKALLEENLNRNTIKPYFANLTIGAGAVGAIVTNKNIAKGRRILGGVSVTDSLSNHLCEGDGGKVDSLNMQTDSEALLVAGINLAKQAWSDFSEHMSWKNDDIDCTICHQVGKRHLSEIYKALELNSEKDFSTFESLGNIGSASVPVTFAKAIETGKINPGDKVALLGIGSGLSSIILGIEG